jgi:hypothetical protein
MNDRPAPEVFPSPYGGNASAVISGGRRTFRD